MKIKEINTKCIITKSKLPDADYVINPYVGCQHACIYCYADFMKRFTGHSSDSWGEFVDVKINSANTIRLTSFNEKTILIGSVTDPYQQTELKYGITKGILKNLIVSQPNIEILTKSSSILRDIDLLSQFKNLRVGISLNTLDAKLSNMMEPYASSPRSRINVIKRLSEAGIVTYLFISPIFPYVTNFKDLLEESIPYTRNFSFENLNIRSNNRTKILEFIKQVLPEYFGFYTNLPSQSSYWLSLKSEIELYCKNKDLNYRIYFDHSNDKKV